MKCTLLKHISHQEFFTYSQWLQRYRLSKSQKWNPDTLYSKFHVFYGKNELSERPCSIRLEIQKKTQSNKSAKGYHIFCVICQKLLLQKIHDFLERTVTTRGCHGITEFSKNHVTKASKYGVFSFTIGFLVRRCHRLPFNSKN